MKASDITSSENNRADAIDKLILFCDKNNMSYIYGEFDFTVKLPGAEPIPMGFETAKPGKQRKSFDTDSWGPKGYHEGEEPDPTTPLEEGESPKETL